MKRLKITLVTENSAKFNPCGQTLKAGSSTEDILNTSHPECAYINGPATAAPSIRQSAVMDYSRNAS